jgi:hypothetical protein
LFPLELILNAFIYNFTTTMVGARKSPGGRTTVTLDGSPGLEVVGNYFEEDPTNITIQFSVSFLLPQLFLHINFEGFV